jgi:hypothetical protein
MSSGAGCSVMPRLRPALTLAALLAAAPSVAQDRVAAYLDLFETWCLSRVGGAAPGDWQAAYPEGLRPRTDTAPLLDGRSATFSKRIDDRTGLSLSQEAFTCTVSDEEPWLTGAERAAVLDGVTARIGRRFPSLMVKDDPGPGWDVFRVWTDGPAGTASVTWGVLLMRVGAALPGTSVSVALPR